MSLVDQIVDPLLMDVKINLQCVVLLQESLHGSHIFADVGATQNLLLLVEPCLLFLHLANEVLERLALFQLLFTVEIKLVKAKI